MIVYSFLLIKYTHNQSLIENIFWFFIHESLNLGESQGFTQSEALTVHQINLSDE